MFNRDWYFMNGEITNLIVDSCRVFDCILFLSEYMLKPSWWFLGNNTNHPQILYLSLQLLRLWLHRFAFTFSIKVCSHSTLLLCCVQRLVSRLFFDCANLFEEFTLRTEWSESVTDDGSCYSRIVPFLGWHSCCFVRAFSSNLNDAANRASLKPVYVWSL